MSTREKPDYLFERIGVYTVTRDMVFKDTDGQDVGVRRGAYEIVASMTPDLNHVIDACIVFQGKDAFGKDRTVVDYPSLAKLKSLVETGTVGLMRGIKPSVLDPALLARTLRREAEVSPVIVETMRHGRRRW